MRKIFQFVQLVLPLFALPALSQTSAITATILDQPDGTAWATLNSYPATYAIQLVSSSGTPVPAGQAFRSDTGATTTNTFTGNLSSSGGLSLTLVSNSNITPSGTQYRFTVCPAVSTPICGTTTLTINASASLSTQLSAVAISPRISGGQGAYAYTDTEVAATPNNGYYNITTPALRCYGASWAACGGGGSGTVTAVTGTAPIVSSGGTTPAISCPTCGTGSGTVTSVTGTTNQVDVATSTTTPVVSIDPGIANCLGGTTPEINGTSYSHCYAFVPLSPTTAPVLAGSGAGATATYTLLNPMSSTAATYLSGYLPSVTTSGYTGSATGNNHTGAITAATTTTITISNPSGTTAYTNNGNPVVAFTTFEVRVNLCIDDAGNGTNGNTNGICDSTGEPATVTQYGQITVQGGTRGAVTWYLAPEIYDEVQSLGASQYAIEQLPDTNIICRASQNSGCQINSFATSGNLYALYGTGTATGYRNLDGLWFKSIHGGTLASGHVCIIQAGYDGSTWNNMQCIDDALTNQSNGTVAVIGGGNTFCCHSNFYNDTFDSEWGQTAVDIEASLYLQTNTINFNNTSINTHGPTATGNPNLLCHDSTPGLQTILSFTGTTYMEGQTATMSSPFIQDNGCRALEFTGALTAYPLATGSTSPIIDVSNAFDTTLSIGNVVAYGGNGGVDYWTWPATIVRQHNVTTDCSSPPCNVAVTDSVGNSPGYHSRTSQFNNVAVGGGVVVGAPAGGNEGNGTLNTASLYVNGSPVSGGGSIPGGSLGSVPYQSAASTTALTAPNTSTATDCYTETGTGSVGAAPVWGSCAGSAITSNWFGPTFIFANQAIAMAVTSGHIQGWGFVPPTNITFSNIYLISNTADASDLYSAAIINSSGGLVCHPTTGIAVPTAGALMTNTCSESNLASVTGISGGSGFSGSGTLLLSGFNNGCSGSTATVTIASGVYSSAVITAAGSGCSAPPTSATCTSGTATCTGSPVSITVATTLSQVTLSAGQPYILATTGNSTTGKLLSTGGSDMSGPFYSLAVTGCTSASGVMSGTCSITLAPIIYTNGIPTFSLH
jgi:hypothetical protein